MIALANAGVGCDKKLATRRSDLNSPGIAQATISTPLAQAGTAGSGIDSHSAKVPTLAVTASLSGAEVGYIANNSDPYGYVVQLHVNSGAYVAFKDNHGVITYYGNDRKLPVAGSYTFWACADDGNPQPFGRITEFRCEKDHLTGLDVSNLPALEWLYCDSNKLTALNVSMNINLNRLNCADNLLKSLDVTYCIPLEQLDCSGNQLVSLDISRNSAHVGSYSKAGRISGDDNLTKWLDTLHSMPLEYLFCANNRLKTLDLSQCVALTKLNCSNNDFGTIDVSSCNEIQVINCSHNPITSLIMASRLSRVYFADVRENGQLNDAAALNRFYSGLSIVKSGIVAIDSSAAVGDETIAVKKGWYVRHGPDLFK